MTVDLSSIGKTALNRIGINAFILLSDFKNKLVQKFGDFVKCLGILVIARNPQVKQ